MAPILVTGATGNVGAEVVRLLRDRGYDVRAAVRDPAGQRNALEDGVRYVAFDFAEPSTFAAALTGVRRMFLLRPPQLSDAKRYMYPVIDAAKAAGVEQIVFLSLLGVENNHFVPHYAIEQYLIKSGVPWTMLRAGFFMQNLSTTHRAEIRDRDEIFVPAGAGKTSFVDVRDLAAVAALALTEDGHANNAYALTGSYALTYYQVANALSEALGRRIVYRKPGLWAFIRRWQQNGTPLSFTLVMAGIYTTARLGLAGRLAPDTTDLLGRPPITIQQFAQDYKACWER